MKKLEIGTIIKVTLPKAINMSLNGRITESDEKDITYYSIEGYRTITKYGSKHGEYKVFDLNNSKYTTLCEAYVCVALKSGTVQIVEEG